MNAKKQKPARKIAGATKKKTPKSVEIRFLKDLKLAENSFKKGDIEKFDRKGAEHLIKRKKAEPVDTATTPPMNKKDDTINQIPKQLQKDSLRFCFVNYKVPFPTGWQKEENTYKYNDPKLLARINTGENYGVIGGYGNLMIVDADTQKVVDAFSIFGDTFTIKTGAKEGKHIVFFVPGLNKSYALAQETKESTPENLIFENIGHITSKGRMVVAPGCKHYKQLKNRKFEPTGKKYDILKNVDIKVITEEQLQAVIKPFLTPEIRKQKETEQEAQKKAQTE